ncbi:MAG: hypothetical protein KDE58_33020, partial [Caldilineaceae bacterium]|nr:hypothetical protein [Caldilineaceae bacterium]
QVNRGFTLWNAPLFTDRLDLRSQDGTVVSHSALPGITLSTTDILPALRATKDFLEKLGRYNTAGKLRNLTITAAEAHDAINYRKQVDRIKKVVAVVDQLQAIASYLSEASVLLPAADPWVTEAQTLRRELLNALRAMAKGDATVSGATWQQTLEALKERYRTQYAALHQRYVLHQEGMDRREALMRPPAHAQLHQLAAVDILNANELTAWESACAAIPACGEFHPALLETTPLCPHCGWRSGQGEQSPAADRLNTLAQRLDLLVSQWHAGLRDALTSSTAQESIAAMTAKERGALDAYLALAEPATATLPAGLADAANKALRGLTTIDLTVAALVDALKQGGLPCTVQELESRFRRFVAQEMRGHDGESTRLLLTE